MTAIRQLAFPFWLAAARLVHQRGRVALSVLGIAVAAATLAGVFGSALIAQDRKIQQSLEALPPDVRSVRVYWLSVGSQAEPYDRLDARVQRELRPVLEKKPIRTLLVREGTILGSFISLGAVDDLSSWSVADKGRAPRRCSPDHCEVLVLRGNGRIPSGPGLRLVPVGRGRLTSSLLFGDAIPPTKNAIARARLSPILQRAGRYHQPAPPPLVLAEGVRELNASPRLHQYYRTYGWVTPIERGDVHPWSIASVTRRIEKMRAAIQESSFGFDVRAPVDELESTAEANRLAGRRLLLLGGQASALFFAFLIVVATRFRRDVDALRERLTWASLPRWQRETTVMVEFLLLAAVGTIIGWAVGTGVVSLIAHRFDEPVGDLLRHSVLSGGGIVAALGLVAAATLAMVIASAVRPLRIGGLSVTALDIAGLGAALAIAVALARGAADADALLRQRGTGLVLVLLPALIAVAAAAVVARLLPWLLRVIARATTRRSVAVRLAALALARNPGYAAVAVSFLVLTTGFAIFAASYRSTLIRGETDQAAFAVGADYVGREDPARLITVQEAASSRALRSLGRDLEVGFATRQGGSIGRAELVTGITVLGLAPETIRNVRGWRPDFGPTPPPQIAEQLAPHRSVSLRGSTLPRSATSLLLRLRVRGDSVGTVVVIRTNDGYFVDVPLGGASGGRWQTLGARIPAEARGGRVVGLRFDPPIRTEEPGAQTGVAARSTVDLRPLRAAGGPHETPATGYRDWIGTPGVRVVGRANGLRLDLALSTQVVSYLRPRQPTDRQDVPVLVSRNLSGLAGRDGRLNVAVNGEPVSLRITSVASRFPGIPATSAHSDFIVADRDTLLSTLNTAEPGAGFVNEIWLNARTTNALERLRSELRRPPFDVLAFDSRAARAQALSEDPISRATTWLLGAAALAALALALLGVLVGAASDVRDEAKELFELEAQGMTPRDIRRHLRARSALMLVAGLVGGAVLGVLFAFVVVDLVALSTGTASPQPPLLLSIGWRAVSAAGFAYIALAGLLLAALTAGAFRATSADENRGRSA